MKYKKGSADETQWLTPSNTFHVFLAAVTSRQLDSSSASRPIQVLTSGAALYVEISDYSKPVF